MNTKQRIVHGQGASYITYKTILFNSDVCRASLNQSPLLTTTSRLAWIHGDVKHSRKKCDLFSLDLQDKLILLFSLELSMKFFFKIQLLFLYLHSFVIFHSPWNACVKKRRIQTRTVGVWEKTVKKGCGFLATFNGRRQKIKHTVKTTRNLI